MMLVGSPGAGQRTAQIMPEQHNADEKDWAHGETAKPLTQSRSHESWRVLTDDNR